jgi:cell division septation protein DedD
VSDDAFHEIQLSGKQIVFLFMAATVVSVVIFLCGVLVGRGVQAGRAAREADRAPGETAAAPASAAGSQGQATAGADTLTYPQRLQGEAPVAESLEPQPAPPPVAAEEPAAPPPAVGAGADDGWVIQVAALRDRDAAMAIVKRLSEKGYPAFVLDPAPGAPAPVHRVRVGRYADRAEAERISRRLEREEQFKPLITR